MKVTPRQYARSLYESLSDKKGPELKAILGRFVRLIGERRELGKSAAIIEAFREIWESEEGELAAELVTARKLTAAGREVSAYLKDRTGAKEVDLRENVSPELIGGFILRYRDKVLDASLKNTLENLQNKLGS